MSICEHIFYLGSFKIRTKNNRNYYKNIFVPTDSNCDENFEDDKNVNRIVEMERAIEEPNILLQLNTGAQNLTSNISTDKHQTDLDGSGKLKGIKKIDFH